MRKQNNNSHQKGGKKSTNSSSVAVKAPVAQSRVSRNKPANISRRGKDEIVVTHREYVTPVNFVYNVDFTVSEKSIAINPGLPISFPWLSTIAPSYESYRFEKVKFCFETSVPTTQQGAFIMCFDYDASDNPPQTKTDFLNFQGAVKGPVWDADLSMTLDSKLMNKIGPSRYIRRGNRSGDIKLYDVGNLYYTIINTTTSAQYGDLFVEYTVVLQTPQMNTSETISDNYASLTNTYANLNYPFNGTPTIRGNMLVRFYDDVIEFSNPGRYFIYIQCSAGISVGQLLLQPSAGLTVGSLAGFTGVETTTLWIKIFLVTVLQPLATSRLSILTVPGNGVLALSISPYGG